MIKFRPSKTFFAVYGLINISALYLLIIIALVSVRSLSRFSVSNVSFLEGILALVLVTTITFSRMADVSHLYAERVP